jgi:uncharacterized membrane protein
VSEQPSEVVEHNYQVDRWPASLALLICIALYLVLPSYLTIQPDWLIPALELVPLITLTITHRHRHPGEPRWTRFMTIAMLVVINLANIYSVIFLVHRLLYPKGLLSANNGRQLIFNAVIIWVTNVIIFGLWYWEIDAGGPARRGTSQEDRPDFQFPQMVNPELVEPDWRPRLLDYLYVSFTNATAFSPTDAMPLTRRIKGMMAVSALVSLITVLVVAARAISILK